MRRGYTTPLVIAIMAFAVVAFLFLIDTAINPDGSKKSTNPASTNKNQNSIACTADAKLCDDGSYVSRTGPKCEFAECPNNEYVDTTTWKAYTNTIAGFSIRYPANYSVEHEVPPGEAIDTQIVSPTPRTIFKILLRGPKIGNTNLISSEQVTLAGQPAIKKVFQSNSNTKKTYTVYSLTNYRANGWTETNQIHLNNEGADSKIAETILTTFTLTDPTAGWKTYTNPTLGYTVNYPASWKTSTCSGNETVWFGTQGVVCASDAGTWDFSITKQSTSFNLQQTLTQTKSFMVDSEQTGVTVDGVAATRLSGQTKDDIGPGSNQYIVTIYVPHNNRYFTLQYAANGVIGEEYKNNFELFTQSFTFTD